MGRPRKNNYNPVESPPSYDDLKFQADSWYLRYPTNSTSHLSPESYRALFSDKTLSWFIGNQISGAAAILLREDDDSL